MPTAVPARAKGEARIVIPHVHIFSAGQHQGEDWTERDLQDMVNNFKRFSTGPNPLVENPAVIGHEEDQELLDNTGIPAAGWVVGLSKEGPDLFADVSQVFPSIADLIEAGAYKHVSAEIYPRDNPPEGVPARGCMLRRVAFLGGQLPHIKSLADLPQPIRRHFECRHAPRVRLTPSRRVWQDTSRTWACFSEVTAMADDATTQVAAAGIQAAWGQIPPDVIAKLVDTLTPDQMGILAEGIVPAEAPEGDTGASAPSGMAEWPAEAPSREAVIAALVAQGQDEAALNDMSDEELISLYTQTMGPALSEEFDEEEEPIVATTATPIPAPTPAPVPARRQPTKVTTTQQFSEQRLTLLEKRLAAAEQQQRRRERLDRLAEANKKKGLVRTFCEQLAKNGKASPAEVEFDKTTGEPLGALAFALSAASAVRKFSEGKEAKSDLEVLMEKLEQRPVRKFGEQVQDPVKGSQGGQLSQDRREQLLSLTGRGRALLAKESERKQNARMFAEQLAGVLQVKLNGQTG